MKTEWRIHNLGDVSDFEGGSQPPKSNFADTPREGYIRLLQIRDFKSDKYAVYIPVAKKNRTCKADDIMIGRYGASVGQIHRGKAGAYNVALIKTIPDESKIDKDFFYHYLTSDFFQKRLASVADRSAQAGFSKADIAPFEILLPPLPEQKRIVAILDEAFAGIDQAIANTEKNLASARELFESTLNAIFTQKCAEWHEYELQKITTKIGSGATPRGGNESYKSEGISLIRSLNVYDREFRERKLAFIDEDQAKKLSNVEVNKEDVLFNITGASIARCCIAPAAHLPARVNQHVSILRPQKEKIISNFLCYLMTSQKYKKILLGIGDDGGSTRQAITKKQLQELKVFIPKTLVEQKKIVCNLDEISEQTQKLESALQQKLTSLNELKQSLLQKAFSGELTADIDTLAEDVA